MTCHNCLTPNPVGVSHCQRCRMPGDFGVALEKPVAKVVEPQHVTCGNCAGHAPAQARSCPTCRWPLPLQQSTASPTRPAAPHLRRVA